MGCSSSKQDAAFSKVSPKGEKGGGGASQEVAPSPAPSPADAEADAEPATRKTSFMALETGSAGEDYPIPTSHLGFHSNSGIKSGLKINQDRGMITYPYAGDSDRLLLGVYDGHGKAGHRISEKVAFRFVELMEEEAPREVMLTEEMDVQDAALKQTIEKCVVATDEWLGETEKDFVRSSGTTAIVAMLGAPNSLLIGNVGDSRAVLGRADQHGVWYAIDLSKDHKVDEPVERARLEAAGGVIEEASEGCSAAVWSKQIGVGGGLSMSRSLGDHGMGRELVISTPEVTSRELTENDMCIILASDGVWEFINSQRAVEIVQAASKDGATEACKALIAAATDEWSKNEPGYRDDITAIVAFLPVFEAIRMWKTARSKPKAADGSVKQERRRNSVVMQAETEHQLEEAIATAQEPTKRKKDRLSFTYGLPELPGLSPSRRQE